jgi:hypothetical protein
MMRRAEHVRMRRLAAALDPALCPVDGRDHRDRLAFAAGFARLILYYDKHNAVAGDWRPFFLKDPAILLATIARTDYAGVHAQFSQLDRHRRAAPGDASEILFASQVLGMLARMFGALNDWLHYLERGDANSMLRDFLERQIGTELAGQLWRVATLQNRMNVVSAGRVAPFDSASIARFEPVWRARKAGDAQAPPAGDDMAALADRLPDSFTRVFDVFTQAIVHADAAFDAQAARPTPYPDTALLMAFSRLMAFQQDAINGIGMRHLDFYYDRILRLAPRQARADEVYVCLALARKVDRFVLPAGTVFSAGTYPDNGPIAFVNDDVVELTRAAVTSVRTLCYVPDGAQCGLYLGEPPDPGKVGVDQAGDVVGWEAFGDAGGTPVRQGFALASPMLLLRDGERTLTVTLCFDAAATVDAGAFHDSLTRYSLSTDQGWYDVAPSPPPLPASQAGDGPAGTLVLTFHLPPDAPPIGPLKAGTDAVVSAWPMLRVMLGNTVDLRQPPSLKSVAFAVDVNRFGQLRLENEGAVLPLQGSSASFGPAPEAGSSLYIGSNECFAKPLTRLSITIAWESLPVNFTRYYRAYNAFLRAQAGASDIVVVPFKNGAFTVVFDELRQQQWLPLTKAVTVNGTPGEELQPLFDLPPVSSDIAIQNYDGLATVQAASTFTFVPAAGASAWAATPALALARLAPHEQAQDGYLRMRLSRMPYAFGHALYPQVMSWVSLCNAQALIAASRAPRRRAPAIAATAVGWIRRKLARRPDNAAQTSSGTGVTADADVDARDAAGVLAPPNPPFTPRHAGVTATYAATSVTQIGGDARPPASAAAPYPFELYHYDAMRPYLAYDADAPGMGLAGARLVPGGDVGQGLPLFPGIWGSGCLYVGLRDVVAPCSLNLLLHVAASDRDAAGDGLCCQYWGAAGWTDLLVLRDGTDNLRTSGIVTLAIPQSSGAAGQPWTPCPTMPDGAVWLAFPWRSASARVRISYLNTGAVKLRRSTLAGLPPGSTPVIGAGAIVATATKIAQLATVSQPFPSFGGVAGEQRDAIDANNSYHQRVSRRIGHRDRASSAQHYVDLAFEACPTLFYAKALAAAPGAPPGAMRIGVVGAVADARQVDAFRPLVSTDARDAIERHLARRMPATAALGVRNLRHQVVRLELEIVVAGAAAGAVSTLSAALNQQLRLYLSPWIGGDGQRMDITRGLHRAALVAMVTAQPEVTAVTALRVYLAGPDDLAAEIPTDADPVLPADDAVLVPAVQHAIGVTVAGSVREAVHG